MDTVKCLTKFAKLQENKSVHYTMHNSLSL